MRFVFLVLALSFNYSSFSQVQPVPPYEWPSDSLVRRKLDAWQDLKFGMIIHWGLYAVPGIVESWPLCSEDWIERDSTIAYDNFKKWYWSLKDSFNPVRFEPSQWAAAGTAAGMKYLVFTTKHHDGFCMFDTKETDFKITDGAFAANPKADATKYIFDAFRKEGFLIGAYFSKPDWHSQNFWWSKYATPNRNTNYDIRRYPWRWEGFKKYTHNQVTELMRNYGKVDLLWLDGGWVRPKETVNEEVLSWGAPIPEWSMDIDMPSLVAEARRLQPGLLVVDRTVHGAYENYRTPEQRIPEKQLDYPWESCMTLGGAWGYVKGDKLKTSAEVIHSMIEIVAKGGNLLLGVGPRPDGTLPEAVTARLQEIGNWMQKNGAAIYYTRTEDVYRDANTWFTKEKDGRQSFALVCIGDTVSLPSTIRWKGNLPARNSKMQLLGWKDAVKWKRDGEYVVVQVPKSVAGWKTPALVFAFEK